MILRAELRTNDYQPSLIKVKRNENNLTKNEMIDNYSVQTCCSIVYFQLHDTLVYYKIISLDIILNPLLNR